MVEGESRESRRMTLSGYPQSFILKADNAYEHRIHPAYYSYLTQVATLGRKLTKIHEI